MDAKNVLAKLAACGSAQTRKTYSRHGVQGPMFGVSYQDLGRLKKTIKTDHPLAMELWASGNHDARILATMIADPTKMTGPIIDRWLKEIDNHVQGSAFSNLVAGSPLALKKAEKWRASKKELVSCCGWDVTSRLALRDQENGEKLASGLDDALFAPLVEVIEKEIHTAPNRTRYAMNQTLIAIGVRSDKLRKLALAAAKRIGKVEVDHGDTSCKTPDAAAYIAKTVAHRAKKPIC